MIIMAIIIDNNNNNNKNNNEYTVECAYNEHSRGLQKYSL